MTRIGLAAAAVALADTFKAKWGGFLKDNCGGCHEKYRAKKS